MHPSLASCEVVYQKKFTPCLVYLKSLYTYRKLGIYRASYAYHMHCTYALYIYKHICKHINIISWIFSDAICKIVLTVINIYDRVLYFPFCSRTIQNVSKWTRNYGHNHIIFHAFIKVMHSSFIQSRIRPPFPYVS